MKEFQVWMEGYQCTGNQEVARCLGTYEAETFEDACSLAVKKSFTRSSVRACWKPKELTYWGCRLFDNGNDAVKTFG